VQDRVRDLVQDLVQDRVQDRVVRLARCQTRVPSLSDSEIQRPTLSPSSETVFDHQDVRRDDLQPVFSSTRIPALRRTTCATETTISCATTTFATDSEELFRKKFAKTVSGWTFNFKNFEILNTICLNSVRRVHAFKNHLVSMNRSSATDQHFVVLLANI
jgi:hypothetical protein